jgi:hypothetical protein
MIFLLQVCVHFCYKYTDTPTVPNPANKHIPEPLFSDQIPHNVSPYDES